MKTIATIALFIIHGIVGIAMVVVTAIALAIDFIFGGKSWRS